MKSKFLIILLLLLNGCDSNQLIGKYEAYWYETYHKLKLKSGNKYVYKSDGHLGMGEFRGTYEVIGDTIRLKGEMEKRGLINFLIAEDGCLIELETRFDYCKRNKKIWGSGKRSINYPQLKEKNEQEKVDVIQMLETALTNPKIRKYFEDTTKRIVVQEYYEIKRSNDIVLTCFNKPVDLKSKEEIESEQIEEYLVVDEINIGLNSAMIDFQVMPEFYIGILIFFSKENGYWKLKKRRTL